MYTEKFCASVPTYSVASKIRAVMEVHSPEQNWHVGKIEANVSGGMAYLTIPLAKWDERVCESVEVSGMLSLSEAEMRVATDQGNGYETQAIKIDDKAVVVTSKPYKKSIGAR